MFVLVKTNKSCFLDEIDQPMCHPGVRNTITVPTVKIPSFRADIISAGAKWGLSFFSGWGGGGGERDSGWYFWSPLSSIYLFFFVLFFLALSG